MGHPVGQWRRHSRSLEERSGGAGSGDYSCLYILGKMGNRNMGRSSWLASSTCLTSFGHAAEPKEVGRTEEEITFGTRIGVSPQSSVVKRALRDASCKKYPDQSQGSGNTLWVYFESFTSSDGDDRTGNMLRDDELFFLHPTGKS